MCMYVDDLTYVLVYRNCNQAVLTYLTAIPCVCMVCAHCPVVTQVVRMHISMEIHKTTATVVSLTSVIFFCRFIVSYIPGGTTGLTFMAKLFSKLFTTTVSAGLDV